MSVHAEPIIATSQGVVPWPEDVAERYRAEGLWAGLHLFEIFARSAAERPDAVALVDGDVRLTYAEVLARAEAGARRLREAGLAADDRIVVQLPNTWQFVVLTLACLRADVVPVFALPAHRAVELTSIAQVAQARALVVPSVLKGFDHRPLADAVRADVPSLALTLVLGEARSGDLDVDALVAPGVEAPAEPLAPAGAVALFLLSGGTTGLPKLIARTHDDYAYNARQCGVITGLDEATVYLVALPAGHNFPLACPGILGTLFAGGRVVMLASPEPSRALAVIASEGVTVTAVVPAVAQRWVDHAAEHGLSAAPLAVLQVGGSRMPDEAARKVAATLGCTLQQVFGMAEGLINMTRLDDPVEVITATQGRPVSAADEIRVVDTDGADVAVGEKGLILTRGPYTPRGYYRSPEANERAFADGWYGSGDVVELRADGNLVVHGRAHDLINRGGEKISAEEVESLAYRVADVELAAAVAMPDPVLGQRLCLYVQVRAGATVTLDEVRASMAAAGIAAFKLPERLVLVDEIPTTKVGKTDKRALRDDIVRRLAQESS